MRPWQMGSQIDRRKQKNETALTKENEGNLNGGEKSRGGWNSF